MRTVGEAARLCQSHDVLERPVDSGFVGPRLQLPQAGSVDQQRSVRQLHQLSGGCRVASPSVGLTDRGHFVNIVTKEAIDEGRFSDA